MEIDGKGSDIIDPHLAPVFSVNPHYFASG